MNPQNQTKRVYELPGDRVNSLEDFYRILGEVINGPGGYFGRTLDALVDCLRGGFGTPDEEFVLRWRHSDISRIALGYPETVRQLELRLQRCHPANAEHTEQELARARRHEGPTVFDWLVEILNDGREDGVQLKLL